VICILEIFILPAKRELAKHEFNALLRVVSVEKRERILKYHLKRDSVNCLLGDILARKEICRYTGLKNDELEFSTNYFGKPKLANNHKIYFNISHSGHYIACAISDKEVGIDIEIIRTVDLKIAENFFAPDEAAYIMTNTNNKHRFYEVWTKKEARIKLEGKGLSMPLQSFSVFNSNEANEFHYLEAYKSNDAICHVCIANEIAGVNRSSDSACVASVHELCIDHFVHECIKHQQYLSVCTNE